MKLLVTNIQHFCLHDGPGIRTTVFLKGCSLHCPWCCNPENISFKPQFYYQKSKCIADKGKCPYGICVFTDKVATEEKLQNLSLEEANYCKSGAIGQHGQWYDPEELYSELLQDEAFWDENGGITFSGGEALMQIDALEPVLEMLKKKGINLCIETALYVPEKAVRVAMEYFDRFYVDVKLLDRVRCKKILGGDLNLYLKNLQIIAESEIPVCLRHPQIKGYTDDQRTATEIDELRKRYPNMLFELLQEHYLGDEKYITLGKIK